MATKESEDVIKFIEGLTDAIIKAKADSSVDWKDLRYVAPLMILGRDALTNAKMIGAEIKGANGEELEALVTRTMTAATLLLDAILR